MNKLQLWPRLSISFKVIFNNDKLQKHATTIVEILSITAKIT